MNRRKSAGDSVSGNQAMLQLLEQMGISDPRIRMIAEMIVQQNAPQSESQHFAESMSRDKMLDEFQEIQRQNEELRHENELLWERNDTLAAALGACPDCWGEDEGCKICRGRGSPGAFKPKKYAFAEYVLPVMKRLRKYKHKKKDTKLMNARDDKSGEGSPK